MNELNILIQDIEQKVAQLMHRIADLEKQNHQLEVQLQSEIAAKEKATQTLTSLQEQQETLKVTNALLGSEEYKRETKLKINSLVREIDHCISQLSQ